MPKPIPPDMAAMQAQIDMLLERVKELEDWREEVLTAATPEATALGKDLSQALAGAQQAETLNTFQ